MEIIAVITPYCCVLVVLVCVKVTADGPTTMFPLFIFPHSVFCVNTKITTRGAIIRTQFHVFSPSNSGDTGRIRTYVSLRSNQFSRLARYDLFGTVPYKALLHNPFANKRDSPLNSTNYSGSSSTIPSESYGVTDET